MPLFRCAMVFSMLAAFTAWAALDNAAGAQPPGKQPDNSNSQRKGETQGKGKGKGQGKTGGPKHEFAGPAPAHPVDLILSRPTDRSITASVMAYTDLEARIDFGPGKTAPRKLENDKPALFLLDNLAPDTEYTYSLLTKKPGEGDFKTAASGRFHTQRKPGSPFTFTLQADSHLDQGTRAALYEKTLANALADKPDFHVDLGDTFMTDKYPKYQDALPQYIAQRYYFGRIGTGAAVFLVPGNHDGERLDRYSASGDSMAVWSCQTRHKYFPPVFPDGFYSGNNTPKPPLGKLGNYYAWQWGDALMIALDPFWSTGRTRRESPDGNWARTLGEEQYKWLEKTLASSKALHKFVFIHHLVGGLDDSARGGSEAAALYEWGGKGKDGKDEFKTRRPGWSLPIHQLLVKHQVDAVFHGHDHFYARQELDGVAYIMVPQPGHQGGDRLRNVDEYGYIRGTFIPPSGHVRVRVDGAKATLEYVRAYLPQNQTGDRKNGDVADKLEMRPQDRNK
ncbi:MAG: metallophosphoesterase [Gemmataceae bacterium]|nr:metallophosphoesterase [Gemmataceae bacterium]